jgi:long-chain acyl-CoA synthetase
MTLAWISMNTLSAKCFIIQNIVINFALFTNPEKMIKENFIKLYENSFRDNWDLPCYTDYGDNRTFTYGQVAEEIARLHLIFKHCSLRRGDKIAIIGRNNSRWCISYMATITYGAIVVPILQDFTPNDVHHIVNHSESVFLFTSDAIWETLEEEKLNGLRGVFSLTDFRCLSQKDGETIQRFLKHIDDEMAEAYPKGFRPEDVHYTSLSNDKVMLLNYTSGTTGFSKGVMLTGNNLAGNVTYGIRTGLLKREEKVLSFLPLAHAYGCAFDFLTATAVGTHITLLGKTPSPKIIMKAFEEVKPNLIITVPLVIEKIYKNVIQPLINKKSMRWALNIPLLDNQIYGQIRKKLTDALGGRFKEIIIGGAAMNPEVEEFFHKIKFPFTIGYGMTECAPLISYAPWNEFIPTSSGKVLDIMEARIYKESPDQELGEIQVRGENVMAGYYKNPEATKEVFTEDGWLRTGDLGTMDTNGNIFIRGRSKTMILGANGQNIFPEEIESKLNNMPFIAESLIIERNKKLVALVYADYESLDSMGLNNSENIKTIMDENLKNLNASLANYEKVSSIQLYPTEFEKTPKKSIKRYLYNSIAEQ